LKLLTIDSNSEGVRSVELTVALAWPQATTLSASRGDEGVYAADSEKPNLVVLEVDLPDMDGYSVCREIRCFSDVPIIMLTERDGEADIVRGLDVGADDYIIKPLNPIVFMARIKAVLRRSDTTLSLTEDSVFEYGHLRVNFAAAKVTIGERSVTLTPKENRLLYHLIKNAGNIVRSRNLLGLVWGRECLEDTHNLGVHINRLRDKLEEDSRAPKYIFTSRGVGYGFANCGETGSTKR